MWLLVFLFGTFTVAIAWICFGCYIFLWFRGLFNNREDIKAVSEEALPFISVIVPFFNEEKDIAAKVNNIKEQMYPKNRMEVVFVNGNSTDASRQVLQANITDAPYMVIEECPVPGKINQLNYALPKAKGEIIVNTDIDGQMKPDCLVELIREFITDPVVMVAGAYSYPATAMDYDEYYWLGQNKGRLLETQAATSSIVIAVCYAFRKRLLQCFPDDTVADDIYVAYLANTLGYRTVYSRRAETAETRTAKRLSEFLLHKLRKSNAFYKETLRFSYRLPEMGTMWQVIYLTKLFQLLFLPLITLFWVVSALSLITLYRLDIVLIGVVFLFVGLVVTNRIFSSVKTPGEKRRHSVFTQAYVFILANLILFVTALSYPFFRQDSNYKKVGGN